MPGRSWRVRPSGPRSTVAMRATVSGLLCATDRRYRTREIRTGRSDQADDRGLTVPAKRRELVLGTGRRPAIGGRSEQPAASGPEAAAEHARTDPCQSPYRRVVREMMCKDFAGRLIAESSLPQCQ